jgi:hypothetical protein
MEVKAEEAEGEGQADKVGEQARKEAEERQVEAGTGQKAKTAMHVATATADTFDFEAFDMTTSSDEDGLCSSGQTRS